MRVRQADWAPPPDWSQIPGKPPTTIADVQGLAAALAARALIASLARVAFTGRYSDLSGLPAFGSAAFVDVSYFMVAWTARTLQVGEVALVATQQSYNVVFTETMNAVPRIMMQGSMDTDSGELIFPVLQKDSITTAGFTFWLSSSPSASAGSVFYEAKVQPQPA